MIFKINKIIDKIDLISAAIGLISTSILIMALVIFLPETAYRYVEAPLMIFIACVVYFFIRKRIYTISGFSYLEELEANRSRIIILNIIYVILISYSIFSVAMRTEPYSRPLGYFVTISLLVAILAIEIIFLPKIKSYASVTLLKIMSVAISIGWTPRLIYPGLIGLDPWWHEMFTMKILELGRIPEGYAYTRLPVMHLIIGSSSLITGLDYRISEMVSISLLQVVSLSFVFLLGKFIYNEKIGLLSALLLATAGTYIEAASRPISLGTLMIPLFIYIVFINIEKKNVKLTLFSLLISLIIILTHTIASVITAIFASSFWLGSRIYNKIYRNEKFKHMIKIYFPIFFLVLMFTYWMYASGENAHLGNLIKWGFRLETPEVTSNRSLENVSENLMEYMLSIFGFNLYIGLSVIGIFFMLSRKFVRRFGFLILIGVLPIMAMIFLALFGGTEQILPVRWYPSLQFGLAIPLSISILLIYKMTPYKSISIFLTLLIIFVLSFFSLVSPITNTDYSFYPNMIVRSAHFQSELNAMDFVVQKWSGEIVSDGSTEYYFKYNKYKLNEWVPLLPFLLSKNFEGAEGKIVLLREEIVDRPFMDSQMLKLNYDPKIILYNQKFNEIYDSSTCHVFIHY